MYAWEEQCTEEIRQCRKEESKLAYAVHAHKPNVRFVGKSRSRSRPKATDFGMCPKVVHIVAESIQPDVGTLQVLPSKVQ